MTSSNSHKNPLLSDSKDADDAAELIKQMHNQCLTAKQPISPKPSALLKASLANIKNDLAQTAVAFASAENVRCTQNAQLCFVEVGKKKIVSNLSADAVDFVPRDPPVMTGRILQQASHEQEDALVDNLRLLIYNVTKQPGDFEDLISMFLEQVKFFLHSNETVERIVELIIGKAIEEDNFKYFGAKLCDKLAMPNILANFKRFLYDGFQKEFQDIRKLMKKKSEENEKYIHGFFVFMAEIYFHSEINDYPLKDMGRSLSKALNDILFDLNPSDIAFVCKMLKLTGAKLTAAFHGNKNDMKNFRKIFTTLQKYYDEKKSISDEKNKRLVLLISSVCSLKDSDWVRTNLHKKFSYENPEQCGNGSAEFHQSYYVNEPIFFTPDGEQYTMSENLLGGHANHADQQGFEEFVPSDEELF